MNNAVGSEDFFDYQGVKSCMDSLDQKFAEFAELLRASNDYMNDNLALDHNSALFGILGTKFLNDWNENASTFGDFYENFSAWSQLMTNIMNQYGGFEDDTVKNAIGQNQASGATLAGVAETRKAIYDNNQLKDFKEADLLANANGIVDKGVVESKKLQDGLIQYTYVDGTVVTYQQAGDGSVQKMVVENVDGTIDTKLVLEDGGMVVERYDVEGKAFSSDIIGPNGEILATRTYTGENEEDTITFYNKDGSTDTVKIYDDKFPWEAGMKDVTTTDMVINGDLCQRVYHGEDEGNISSDEIVDLSKRAVVDNNLDLGWREGSNTARDLVDPGYSTDIARDSHMPSYEDTMINEKNWYSTNEKELVQSIVTDREDNPVVETQPQDIEAVRESYRTDNTAESYGQQSAAFLHDNDGTGTRPSGPDGNVQSGNTVLYNSGYSTKMPTKPSEGTGEQTVPSENTGGQTVPEENPGEQTTPAPSYGGTPVAPPSQNDDDYKATPLPYNSNNQNRPQTLPYDTNEDPEIVYLSGGNYVPNDDERVYSI